MRINQESKSMDIEARDINYILPAYVRSYLFHSKNELPEKIIFPMFESVSIVGADRQLISIPIEWVPPLGAMATEISKDGVAIAEVTPEQEAEIDRKDEETKRLKAELESVPEGEKVEGLTAEEEAYEAAKADQPTPAPEDILRQQEEDALAEQEAAFAAEAEAEAEANPTSLAKAAFAEAAGESVQKVEEKRYKAEGERIEKLAKAVKQPERQPKQPPGGDIGPGLPLSNMQARGGKDQVQTAKDLLEEPAIDESAEKPFEKDISRDKDGKPIVEEKPSATD